MIVPENEDGLGDLNRLVDHNIIVQYNGGFLAGPSFNRLCKSFAVGTPNGNDLSAYLACLRVMLRSFSKVCIGIKVVFPAPSVGLTTPPLTTT